ncbi:MAG TPA: helix-turn-helix domain-containing protein [Thermoguttaceae bacterium]|nr:helix-turn-helix domain-containing protein [Thermoguttaceae bacterium]
MRDVTISPAAVRVVKLLVGRTPQSVAELTKAAGVTRTAITEQLNELENAGLVERTVERLVGRGRPRNRFRATRAALLLLGSGKECSIGRAIWQAIEEVGGDELANKILEQVSSEMAKCYARRVTAKTPAGRLRQMNKLLTEEGLLVEVAEQDDRMTLAKRSCAFISLFENHRRVCQIDERIMTLVVGKQVRQVACRHDGDPCCVFELDKGSRKASP